VKTKKNVLIVTDGASGTEKMAANIVETLKGNKVLVKTASEFAGNDILPADAFFLGCENPAPDSFAYITDLLKHINLAGRPCGVFSSGSEKTAGYLAGLVKDCEAALNPELLTGSASGIENWAQNVISGSFR
jgi:flavodoxin